MNCNHCIFYVAGLLQAFAYDEISFNKIATQSHYPASGSGYDASNAVDGNTATCMRTNIIGSNAPHNTVWWKVDLGGIHNIYSINIQFKTFYGYDTRQRGRFAGFSLYISNADVSSNADIKASTLCYKDGPQLPPLNFTKMCTESGRYVIFYNARLDGITYPEGYEVANVVTELCEVTALGCNNASLYGSNCDTPCSINCKDTTCHILTGVCFMCKPGWTGMYCDTICREGWHGINCSQQCVGHCRDVATCNHVTGQCDTGCAAGWTGLQCMKECNDGNYGYDCVNSCSNHCLNDSPCNKQTGHCDTGCNPGYTNDDCNKECPSGHFGLDCKERCSRYCTYNDPCDHVSGICPSGCQDGYMGTYCNNACKGGYFGTNCSRKCSPNCKPDTCRHKDGSCTSCAAGWTGFNCTTECIFSYGDNCRYPCSVYCINQTCDRINGNCLYGCKYGYQCDQVYFLDSVKHTNSLSSSNHLPITIGGLVGACVLMIIGVVMAVFVIRLKSSGTMCNAGVLKLCLRSSPAAKESVNNEELSTYQELNFSLQENPYQCISR